jgi:hypothetical protein
MILKMKLMDGSEIKLPQDSILNFWAESIDSTNIEYEDEDGESVTVKVAHSMLYVAEGVMACRAARKYA